MDLTLSQSASLRFRLLAAADGSEMTGLVYSDLSCLYATSAMTALTGYGLSEVTVTELGHGVYEVFFAAAVVDALGPLTTYLTATGAVPAVREDVIVEGSTWQGRRVRILVKTAGDVAIDTAHVQVRNSAGTLIVAQGTTDVDGAYDVMLTDGAYKVYVWKSGWTFAAAFPATLTVAADMSYPVTGVPFAPESPGGPEVVTITGWLLDATGAARVGVAVAFTPVYEDEASVSEAELLRPLSSSSTSKLLSRTPITVTTGADGAFSVSLTPNSDILPAGSRYKVTFSDTPAEVALITVPSSGPANIEDLLV